MTIKHFHEGELKLQSQTGMREQIDVMTQLMMRDVLPDQHREFFAGLEYVFLGTVDKSGQPHASLITGAVGFMHSPEPKTLVIQTRLREHQPAFNKLDVGQPVGVLGLDLSNRRRNRMHGRVSALDETSITITVVQSYGNCPKYISLRDISERQPLPAKVDAAQYSVKLSDTDVTLIKAADTFFIASYVQDGTNAPYEGVDVNHRGGTPGFVHIEDNSSLTIPDYKGNYLFNTFGNLLLNPAAGLLFIDFETGDQLHVHGQAELIEDEATVARFLGAQRLLRVRVGTVTRTTAATALRWKFVEASPFHPEAKLNKA